MEPEILTADEKAKEIFKATETQETPDDLTELDELNIIENKGIEYILRAAGCDDLPVYVAPLKVAQYRTLFEMQKSVDGESVVEQLERATRAFSEIFKIDEKVLSQYLDADDVKIISGLLVVGVYEGKKLFAKKKFRISESKTMQNIIGRFPKPNVG